MMNWTGSTIENRERNDLVPLKVVRLADRISQKWHERDVERTDAGASIPGSKCQITCKCPLCGSYHDTVLQWTGRGTPRLFCPTCRNRVAAMNEGPTLGMGDKTICNIRRGTYRGHE